MLKTYDLAHLDRLAMPLGGIGTGTISLGGRGDLRDWEMGNHPAKGFKPGVALFALWTKQGEKAPQTKLLEGPLPQFLYEGSSGSPAANHGWPRFRNCEFHAAYPLGQVVLTDSEMPVDVRLEAFNPMIPADADSSGIPCAVLRYVLRNKTNETVSASVSGSIENFICVGVKQDKPKRNINEIRNGGNSPFKGVFMRSPNVDPKDMQWGTLALAAIKAHGDISFRTSWPKLSWGDSLLDFWDDFSTDGKLEERHAEEVDHPVGSLAVSVEIPPNDAKHITFLLTWHFPNRLGWGLPKKQERVGNYYNTKYWDAWDVVEKTSPHLAHLEEQTVSFVRAFVESDLPEPAKEAALFNASTLRTQTCFRTEDGRFFGWEGCNDQAGCCHGNCTHVWNYEQTTAFLYGELARSMRDTEFEHATSDKGLMSFRINLPLAHAQEHKVAAADGQMGTIMRLYRDWRLSGDEKLLKESWPAAKRALQFAWIPGGWDANKDGIMEGCQHNTMDVEYFGPNPEIGVWYLGALRACEEMARHAGDDAFASTCRDIFERGRKWMDANLFNGEYYEHQIQPAGDLAKVAPGLSHGFGGQSGTDPVLQVGAGCLADQLVGQYMASVCGLGELLDPAHMKAALASIMKYNFRENFFDHFNHLRTYALQEDAGLIIATYPKGRRPKRPFPYCNEVWTGIEYTAATGMIYAGLVDEGLKVIAAARARHDGRKRNPFDEPECGHHYARAMAAWGAILALTGFHYDGVSQTMRFNQLNDGKSWFWSNGNAWGTVTRQGKSAKIGVQGGQLAIKKLTMTGVGSRAEEKLLHAGESAAFELA